MVRERGSCKPLCVKSQALRYHTILFQHLVYSLLTLGTECESKAERERHRGRHHHDTTLFAFDYKDSDVTSLCPVYEEGTYEYKHYKLWLLST